jgi:hypothetical protein
MAKKISKKKRSVKKLGKKTNKKVTTKLGDGRPKDPPVNG